MQPVEKAIAKLLARELITTGDGSKSIFMPAADETYHSRHGAVQESRHVFIKMGWEKVLEQRKEISILEMGFGTGLNAFLVLLETMSDASVQVHYTSLEAFAVNIEMALQLNYAAQCGGVGAGLFEQLHRCDWNKAVPVAANFSFEKRQIRLEDFRGEESVYDLIFFDAFAPRVQPELWTKEVFAHMYSCLRAGGILVTYCAKGEVRRNMQAAGFTVARLAGPPGKREMLRAVK
jgi:tRNA U34 5-methylaminomethyl-2-thiouridine-forming methyltransferase MnmC